MDKKPKKDKRYLVIAKYLENLTDYCPVSVIASDLGMNEFCVRVSIAVARKHLAKSGIMIVNKTGLGYKVGNFTEFKLEADKSCRRALNHLGSMANLIVVLSKSKKIDGDFRAIFDVIDSNLDNIRTIYHKAELDDDDDIDYGLDEVAIPDHIAKIAYDEIELK